MKHIETPYGVNRGKALGFLILCLGIQIGAVILADLVQQDFGRVEVRNVVFSNYNALAVRAKLFRPRGANGGHPVPGIVFIHGYQNNRETSDAYGLELARRGFAVLAIDALGRGNSDLPGDPRRPDFDPTYGGKTSLAFLRSLPFVNPRAIGLMGHSLGGEMAYRLALNDPDVRATAFSGFGYTLEATTDRPKNMLMIIGQYDEFRRRMTGVRNIEKEWLSTPQSRKVFPVPDPRPGTTYGDFALGTARRVFIPPITHIQESHDRDAVAEALDWLGRALAPDPRYWLDPRRQTWPIKEGATLLALLAGLAALMPLGALLLDTKWFQPIKCAVPPFYYCSWKSYLKFSALNGLLLWLYLPLIFLLFGIHVYLVKIDRAFPLMMVNGIVWWFFWINLIGFGFIFSWYKRRAPETRLAWLDLGVSFRQRGLALDLRLLGRTLLLAALLFAFAYGSEHLLETLFIIDFRFIFPFASDLTPERAWIGLRYFPFLLVGTLFLGLFIHGPLRLPARRTGLKTCFAWSFYNLLALITPLLLFLAVQYVPLLTTGFIPFEGPGGLFIPFIQSLFHLIAVLLLTIPLSTWFFQLTGKIYLGAILNAALITWMFASSQVIAPLPI
jgi:pimeloyl-ACP methyl ester carboxylesterase